MTYYVGNEFQLNDLLGEGNDSMVKPKKTKWYSNILESRSKNNPGSRNANDDKDINKQI